MKIWIFQKLIMNFTRSKKNLELHPKYCSFRIYYFWEEIIFKHFSFLCWIKPEAVLITLHACLQEKQIL